MKPVDATPLPTLCCELNPLMATSGRRIYQDEGLPSYLGLAPLKCHFCNMQVCEECWKSGKHFIKNFVASVDAPEEGWTTWQPVKVSRDIPACIDPWKNALLRTKAKL